MKIPLSTIKLRKICQHQDWDCPQRSISIYLSRLSLKIGLTADQVTGIDYIIGFIGVLFFFIGTNLCFLIGGIFIQFFEIFDCVDGEVARYRLHQGIVKNSREKLSSEFFQDMAHPIIHPLIFLGFSFGLFRLYNNQALLILGFLAALGMSIDTYVNTLREKLLQAPGIQASRAYKEMMKNVSGWSRKVPLGEQILKLIAFLVPIPGVVTVLMLAPILDYIFFRQAPYALMIGLFPLNFKVGALIFYAIVQQLLWILNARTSIKLFQRQ